MLGTIVNAITVLVCSLLGCFIFKGIPERFTEIIKKAIGLATIYIGVSGALANEEVLLLVLSLVIGAIIGELINIDAAMNRLGAFAEKQFSRKTALQTGGKSNFAKGFVDASILFCSGSMAIVGAMQDGLLGNHEILFAKSVLDGTISIVFAASLGIGVAFSSVSVLVYQGIIALAALAARGALSPDAVREMGAVGNLLVAAIGFNFLEIKTIRVANLIPAIFIPLIYYIFV
jgi:uncharacterized membrane protein YqgA involved in biofilm formation